MTVRGANGPELAPRQGPGYDPFLPHDAVHLIVEAEAGLAGAVFGRVAAGHSDFFTTVDPRLRRRHRRRARKHRQSALEHAEMVRSEHLAGICTLLWALRTGRRRDVPGWSALGAERLDPDLIERVHRRLDDFAGRWSTLAPGGTVTMAWPLQTPGQKRAGDSHAPTGMTAIRRGPQQRVSGPR